MPFKGNVTCAFVIILQLLWIIFGYTKILNETKLSDQYLTGGKSLRIYIFEEQ